MAHIALHSAVPHCRVVRHAQPRSAKSTNSGIHNLPLLIYRAAITADRETKLSDVMERTLSDNGYPAPHRFGKFDQAHFHSITHEILGVSAGSARFRFGGPEDAVVEDVHAGDVMLLPAGLVHRCIEAQDGFEMVGAYPGGKKNARGDEWDMCYGKNDKELDEAVANIQSVQMLVKDPVYGDHGPVFEFWKN